MGNAIKFKQSRHSAPVLRSSIEPESRATQRYFVIVRDSELVLPAATQARNDGILELKNLKLTAIGVDFYT
jgi:hypothetical protein